MDAERFDGLARAMANGATRRRALRLAGGGLAGALLAAVGVGKRAGAQGAGGEQPLFTHCYNGEAAGPAFDDGISIPIGDGKPCGGPGECREGQVCIALVNPAAKIFCRCVKLR